MSKIENVESKKLEERLFWKIIDKDVISAPFILAYVLLNVSYRFHSISEPFVFYSSFLNNKHLIEI
jgi:hypothetical protein